MLAGTAVLMLAALTYFLLSHRQTPASGNGTTAARSSATGTEALSIADSGRALADAFGSGALPAPLALPSGSIETQASDLADIVAAKTKDSTAALVTAVLSSGYDLRGDDNQITHPAAPTQTQGLALDAWMIAASAKLYGEDYGIGLDALAAAFSNGIPALKGANLSGFILDGVRAAAKSDAPQMRFLAFFLSELGRRSPQPFDLLDPSTTSAVRLDAIQVTLILSRFAGDLGALAHQSEPRVALARFDRVDPVDPSPPCSLNEVQGLITDYTALGLTTGFGQLAEYLKDHGVGGMAEYGEHAAQATAVMTVLKVIGTYAALDVKIEMDGKTLVRTKNTEPGERHKLTATIRMNTGKWQAFNCVRQVLNLAGMDFNLPGDGPLGNVKVTWDADEGGGPSGLEAALDTAQHLIDILRGHAEDDPAALFYFDEPNKSPAMDAIDYTDDEGKATTTIVGMPQAKDLSNRALMPHIKRGGVSVKVQVKPTRLKDKTGVAGTAGDMAVNVVSGLTGDMLGMTVGVAAETIYRSQWYQSDPFYFEVKDWEPCHLAWTGTITQTTTFSNTEDKSGPNKDTAGDVIGQDHTTHVRTKHEVVTVEAGPHGEYADSIAHMTLALDGLDRTRSNGENHVGCMNGSAATQTYDYLEDNSEHVAGAGSGSLEVSGEDRDVARIDVFTTRTAMGPRHEYRHSDSVTTCPNVAPTHITMTDIHSSRSEALSLEIDVPVDHKHPDLLKGSKTETESDGTVVVTTWDLARCRESKPQK